jgi:hypothetical protein
MTNKTHENQQPTSALELLAALEDIARQHCYTNPVENVYQGVTVINITDSGALSADADALRVLAQHGRFRIIREHGRMVVGYWPENDPKPFQP